MTDKSHDVVHGDAADVLRSLPENSIGCLWADPPYFLSGSGTTCRGGMRAPVAKGGWDLPRTWEDQVKFHARWLSAGSHALRHDGSIWVAGSHHSIAAVRAAAEFCGRLKVQNEVVWAKTNPPPNLGCRCFVHAHEYVLWMTPTWGRHVFRYKAMKARNGNKQMGDVWIMSSPRVKGRPRHPAEKPISLVSRCVDATCPEQGLVVDPFCGSGTTSIASMRSEYGLASLGVDSDMSWVTVARDRIRSERMDRYSAA